MGCRCFYNARILSVYFGLMSARRCYFFNRLQNALTQKDVLDQLINAQDIYTHKPPSVWPQQHRSIKCQEHNKKTAIINTMGQRNDAAHLQSLFYCEFCY